MEKININSKSWHARLALVYAGLHPWEFIDSCRYIRNVIKGMVIVFLLTIFASMILLGPVDLIVWFLARVMTGSTNSTPTFIVIVLMELGLVLMVLGAIVISTVKNYFEKRIEESYNQKMFGNTYTPPKEPSTILKLYHSFKNRYCVPVNIK